MVHNTAEGFIVARSLRGAGGPPRWELVASFANRPSADVMAQYRRAWPGYSVGLFTESEWVGLPFGLQEQDWVTVHNRSYPRSADGVRPR